MTTGSSNLKMMKCIQASDFGAADEVLSKGMAPVPTLEASNTKQLLIKVHACSLTPGDYRMLHGDAKFVKKPKAGFPYIPGLDVSGTVVAVVNATDTEEEDNNKFKVGDEVVATWDVFGEGGMAEYALVDKVRTVHRPEKVDRYVAAALANSACHALKALREAGVGEGSRLLVLGGTGGVGMAVILLARREFKVSYIAATASDTRMLERLGVDTCINYKEGTIHWSEAIINIGEPVDAVIDCAEGVRAWTHPGLSKAVRIPHGKFVAVVINDWHIYLTSFLGIVAYMSRPLWRIIASRTLRRNILPAYVLHLDGPDKATMKEIMKLAEDGKLDIELHNQGTLFEFSEQGAKDAFNLLYSRRARGKIVMKISDE